jgi:hypothetical protein
MKGKEIPGEGWIEGVKRDQGGTERGGKRRGHEE